MCSFIILPRTILTDKKYSKLDNDACMAYMLLCDRMKVSIKNKWVDHRNHQNFVYYRRDDLARDTRVGKTKMSRILKAFLDLDLLTRTKDPVKKCYRLFLPKFMWRTGQRSNSKLRSNNKSNNNKSHDNEYDSRFKGIENRKQPNTVKIPKYDTKLDQQNANKASKSMRIPKAVTNMMARNLGGKTLYKCIHILAVTSRKHIIKKHHNVKPVKYALDFDINEYYNYNHGRNFAKYIDHGLRKAFHNARNMYSYFMTVCKTYYGYALKWFKNQRHEAKGPEIPIFKI